jgi:hypothetical protein
VKGSKQTHKRKHVHFEFVELAPYTYTTLSCHYLDRMEEVRRVCVSFQCKPCDQVYNTISNGADQGAAVLWILEQVKASRYREGQ